MCLRMFTHCFKDIQRLLSGLESLKLILIWITLSLKRHSIMRRAGELQACWSNKKAQLTVRVRDTVHTWHMFVYHIISRKSIEQPVELACLLPWRNLVGCTSWVPTQGTEEQDRGNLFSTLLGITFRFEDFNMSWFDEILISWALVST